MNVHNLVKWFQLNYPKLVKSMQDCTHHYDEENLNPYHLEGDVWSHTMMVMLEASKRLNGGKKHDAYMLILALLHDIGKPVVARRNDEKKRVNFYSHEPMSGFMCLPILYRIEKDFNISLDKRMLIEVISIHTDVFRLTEGQLTERLVNNHTVASFLIKLAQCDGDGRFFEMGDRINTKLDIPVREASKDKKVVVMNIGIPCSGKSTFTDGEDVKDLFENGEFEVLSRDDIVVKEGLMLGCHTYNECFEKVDHKRINSLFNLEQRKIVKSDKSVVIDMTNMGRKSRRSTLSNFKNYKKVAVVHMTDLFNIYKRNDNREGKTIPQNVFKRMISSFQPPMYDEFDDIYWIFN